MLVNNGVAKNRIICLHLALNCCCKKLHTEKRRKKIHKNLNIHLVHNGNQFKTSSSASTIRSCWNLLLSVKSEFFMLFPSQHPLVQQCSSEQTDADWGRSGSDRQRRGPRGGGRSPTGCGQWGRWSDLQLLLLPLQSLSGLALHYDDAHKLVQVSMSCLLPLHLKEVRFSPSADCLLWFSRPDADTHAMQTSMPAVWVKISSSWIGLGLYLWTLVAPLVLPDRDFS